MLLKQPLVCSSRGIEPLCGHRLLPAVHHLQTRQRMSHAHRLHAIAESATLERTQEVADTLGADFCGAEGVKVQLFCFPCLAWWRLLTSYSTSAGQVLSRDQPSEAISTQGRGRKYHIHTFGCQVGTVQSSTSDLLKSIVKTLQQLSIPTS